MPTETHNNSKNKSGRNVYIAAALIVLILGGGIAGSTYILASQKKIGIDKAQVSATLAVLAPTGAGVLKHVYVHEGDVIAPNTTVAQVGVELIKSTSGGIVTKARTDLGASIKPGESVVETVDPSSLRVVGEIDENKGLSRIKVGQPVTFSVDAFGSKQYDGVVDEVSPTSNQSGIVFNISSQREVQQFDIKARFDTTQYPELKNGMSARMTVWTQ